MAIARVEWGVETRGRGAVPLTQRVQDFIAGTGLSEGLCNVFVHHTSASLMLCENADPDVLQDLESFFARMVPDGDPRFTHDAEGPDDMPAHVRAVWTGSSLTIPVSRGRCDLGTWQGIFLYEHRHARHRRRVTVTLLG